MSEDRKRELLASLQASCAKLVERLRNEFPRVRLTIESHSNEAFGWVLGSLIREPNPEGDEHAVVEISVASRDGTQEMSADVCLPDGLILAEVQTFSLRSFVLDRDDRDALTQWLSECDDMVVGSADTIAEHWRGDAGARA